MISSSGEFCVQRKITKKGVQFNGDFYWSEKLVGAVGPVWVGSKWSDPECVEIFDLDNGFICDAGKVKPVHPITGRVVHTDNGQQFRQ